MKGDPVCTLCPKGCRLGPGETGDCGARRNVDGTIRCIYYGHPCSIHVDPIEKKPLFHFLPGSKTLSIATPGCNLHCLPCQNWAISQNAGVEEPTSSPSIFPENIVQLAIDRDCPSIAYTYTEPLVSYEYTYDCCQKVAEAGLKNILVTAAFINPAPLRELCRYVDAANVDLKAFSDSFYREICSARLAPILKALETMVQCNVMVEITNLLIPNLNDSAKSIKELCTWVAGTLGCETPMHFSRFFPRYRLAHLSATPLASIERARAIALDTGLRFVYDGNTPDGEGETTWCPHCKAPLIERSGFRILECRCPSGTCPHCGTRIPGVWHKP